MKPNYQLTPTQKKFVEKAIKEGFEVDYTYSGRYMFGRKCPAVVCRPGEFGFRGASQDGMGKSDVVIYMP